MAEPSLDNDPRWQRLHDRTWVCPSCGETHGGVFDLVHDRPDYCPKDLGLSDNAEALSSSHFVSEDFCVLDGENYFVRGVLEIPIVGAPGTSMGYGVWSSLSRKNFDLYVEEFDTGNSEAADNWFGWFSNRLKGYPDTLSLKCKVKPRHDRQRPQFELEPTDHPLAVEQRDGMSFDRLLDIYVLNGHDLRAALSE